MAAVETFSFLDTLNECIAFIKTPSTQTKDAESNILEQVRKYFISANDPVNSNGLSEEQIEMIDFMKSNLQYLTNYPDTIRINAYQLKKLFELQPDVDILLLLSTYYACFYLTDIPSESILTKKQRLINELLCAVYHEIILKLIEEKKSYDDYFSYHIIRRLRTSMDSEVRATYNMIDKVVTNYNLIADDIITFLENSDKFYEIIDNWPSEYLYNYMKNKAVTKNATFEGFLKENQLQNLFNIDEILKYEPLFKLYVTKLVKREIGAFQDRKVAA
jgi:hypothetical protein